MALTCNIDRRGRRARLMVGAALIIFAIALAIGAWVTGRPAVLGTPSGIALLLGIFALFEAARGWCALRAMGIRTPI